MNSTLSMRNARFIEAVLGWSVLLAAVGFSGTAGAFAQFGPLVDAMDAPQAKTEEELDLYLKLVVSTKPRASFEIAERFAAEYPKSELLGLVFEYEMQACQRLDDFEGILRAGRKALELQPDNADTQLTLASVIPDHALGRPDSARLLQEAEGYSRGSLRELSTMHIPKEILPERWKTLRGQLEAQAHEALGKIERNRGDLQAAIAEFALAALHNPVPQGMQFFELGAAYAQARREEEAQRTLQRAVDLGPDSVREAAQRELAKIAGNRIP
jgi:tetratricopeptide (TPR) repeat protein